MKKYSLCLASVVLAAGIATSAIAQSTNNRDNPNSPGPDILKGSDIGTPDTGASVGQDRKRSKVQGNTTGRVGPDIMKGSDIGTPHSEASMDKDRKRSKVQGNTTGRVGPDIIEGSDTGTPSTTNSVSGGNSAPPANTGTGSSNSVR